MEKEKEGSTSTEDHVASHQPIPKRPKKNPSADFSMHTFERIVTKGKGIKTYPTRRCKV
jgi:hypothetical protein